MPEPKTIYDLKPGDFEVVDQPQKKPAPKSIYDLNPGDFEVVNDPGSVVSIARGGLQGLSLDNSDEIIGGVKAVYDTATDPTKELKDFKKTYQEERNKERVANETAKAFHPWLYGGAELAGGGATTALTGGTDLLAAGALGAASAAGASDTEYTDHPLQGAGEMALGTGVGLLTQGVANKLGGVVNPEAMEARAAQKGVKAVTGNNTRSMADAESRGVQRMGDKLNELGITNTPKSTEGMYKSAKAASDTAANTIKEVGKVVDESGEVLNKDDLAQKMKQYADDLDKNGTEETRRMANRVRKEAAARIGAEDMTFSDAQTLKNRFKFKKQLGESNTYSQDVTNDLNRMVSDAQEELVSRADQKIPGVMKKYSAGKENAEAAIFAKNSLKKKLNAENKNASIGLLDTLYSGAGAATGGKIGSFFGPVGTAVGAAVGGVTTPLVTRTARRYGNQTQSAALYKMADMVKNNPQLMTKYLPASVLAKLRTQDLGAIADYLGKHIGSEENNSKVP